MPTWAAASGIAATKSARYSKVYGVKGKATTTHKHGMKLWGPTLLQPDLLALFRAEGRSPASPVMARILRRRLSSGSSGTPTAEGPLKENAVLKLPSVPLTDELAEHADCLPVLSIGLALLHL